MVNIKCLLIIALTFLCVGTHADGTLPTPLLAGEDSWAPYSNKQGEGISKDIISAAFAEVNIKPKFITAPYARVLHMTDTGAADGAFNVTRQSSTEQTYLFGQEPLFTASASWYFPSSSQHYKNINELPKRLKIGLIIGYEYGDEFEKQQTNFQEVRVNNQRQLVKMLSKGRIDAAIMFDRVAEDVLSQINLPGDSIRRGFSNHNSDIYIAFSRSNPHSRQYADLLDQGLRKLKDSDRYQQLLNH